MGVLFLHGLKAVMKVDYPRGIVIRGAYVCE